MLSLARSVSLSLSLSLSPPPSIESGTAGLRELGDTHCFSDSHPQLLSAPPPRALYSFPSPLSPIALSQPHFGGFLFHPFGGPAVCLLTT